MFELGTYPPDIELIEVPETYEVEVGDMYGFEYEIYPFPGVTEEQIANDVWKGIEDEGDKPIYVSVEMGDWIELYKTKVFGIAERQKTDTPIWIVLLGVAAVLAAVATIIYEVYYIIKGEPIPLPTPTATSLGLLLMILVFLYWLSKKE